MTFGTEGWETELKASLLKMGRSVLCASVESLNEFRENLLRLLSNPVDTGTLLLYPIDSGLLLAMGNLSELL